MALKPPRQTWSLTRLTADAGTLGLSGAVARRQAGRLFLRSHAGRRAGSLYQTVAGGQPIRLTSDGAGNTTPDFSPDGSRIVFRSNREAAASTRYRRSAERFDSWRGRIESKYSPDGSQVAYWVGGEGVAAAVPGSGAVWVVPAAGGQPQRIGSNFTAARYPIWSPDGKHLLLHRITRPRKHTKGHRLVAGSRRTEARR